MNIPLLDVVSIMVLFSAIFLGFLLLYLYKKSGKKPPLKTEKGEKFTMPLLYRVLYIYSILAWLTGFGFHQFFKHQDTAYFVITLVFALVIGAIAYIGINRSLVISNNKLTFYSWRGSTAIEWSQVKKVRWSTTWFTGIAIETEEGNFFFHRGWLGMHHFVQLVFENVPWDRIGTKEELKPYLEPKHG